MNKKKIYILIPVFTVILLILITFGASFYLCCYALSPIKPQNCRDSSLFSGQQKTNPELSLSLASSIEATVQPEYDRCYKILKENASIVSTTSFDNLNLNAYLLKPANSSHKYVICVHGYHSEPRSMSNFAVHYFDYGWNALVIGQRGHGWSDGSFTDMGAFACRDLISWSQWIINQDPQAQILFHGVSMGAATVMLACQYELPPNVLAAIEDCGYSSVWDQFGYRLTIETGLPKFPVLNIASCIGKTFFNIDFKKVAPVLVIDKCKIPMLFIHGDMDDYVPYEMFNKIYDKAQCPKDKLIVNGAKHARSVFVSPDAYWEKIENFTQIFN